MKTRKVNQKYEIITKSGQQFKIDHYKVNGYYSCDIYRLNPDSVWSWYQSFNRETKEQLFQSVDGNINYIKGLY